MQLWELFVIAVGLSMDAFAVSICKGLPAAGWSHALTAGAWFGGLSGPDLCRLAAGHPV